MNQAAQGYQVGGVPYTIEQALDLMRRVPIEGLNQKLVVQVMRATLESAGVSIPQLLEMATNYQDRITDEIVRLQGEIANLHQQIEEKSGQVASFQDQLAEIGTMRERFED